MTKLNDIELNVFEAISKTDLLLLKTLLPQIKNVNMLDEDSMTPLQHAAYKGNKDMVQLLIDEGADVNYCEHQHKYTALHFAALSGQLDVCTTLLLHGAKPDAKNTVNRTPAQMAAFVGHHGCVACINNFIPKSDIDYYLNNKPILPKFIAESFHKFIMQVNIHPVKVTLNLQSFIGLLDHLEEIKEILEDMRNKEMKKGSEINEVLALKFHYLSCIVMEINKMKSRQNPKANDANEEEKKLDITELFIRKLLKPSKDNTLDVIDGLIREYIREFPFRDCTLFRQVVTSLASGKDAPSALHVLNSAINGQRGFVDSLMVCSTCGEENPAKKCSKCKVVQYCDRKCQRLHWHWHKKACARLSQASETPKTLPDPNELSSDLQNLLAKN